MTLRIAATRPLWLSEIDQADSAQAALAQGAQEVAPECFGLTATDHHSQHLGAAVLADAGGDDHGLGDDPMVYAHLALGCVQVEAGESAVIQGSAADALLRKAGVIDDQNGIPVSEVLDDVTAEAVQDLAGVPLDPVQ